MARATTFLRAVVLFIGLVALVQFAAAGEDFYKLLGVSRDATKRQIKKAYRDLSIKYHPDKNKGDKDAESKFMAITNAYEALSDDDKRRIYDQHGEEGLKKGNQQGGGNPFGDIFSQFGFGFGGQQQQGEQKGAPITVDLPVTLKELYMGKDIEVQINKQILCRSCGGTGAENPMDVETCPVCQGRGVVMKKHQLGPGFIQQVQTTCDKCGGKGKLIKRECPVCKGKKVTNGENELMVVVEAGMPDGHRIVFQGEADQGPNISPGDVTFVLRTQPHDRFRRTGNDLHYKTKITLLEALVGFRQTFSHLDGHSVLVTRDEITPPGYIQAVKGEGMPLHEMSSEHGTLFVEYEVVMPKQLTDEQKTQFKTLLANAF